MLEQRIITPEQQKFVAKLLGFDFEIKYQPGHQNLVADALSRYPQNGELTAVSGPVWEIWERIRAAILNDPEAEWRDGLIFEKGKVWVPSASNLHHELIKHFHDSRYGGHSGVYRTWARMSNSFTWSGMKKDVRDYVGQCDVCQRVKSDSQRPSGLLQPLLVPKRIWEDLTMDFIEGLPMSNDYNGILVVVDRLSKYAHFIPLVHPYTSKSVARLFVEYIIKLHGPPRSIISDRYRIFISNF